MADPVRDPSQDPAVDLRINLRLAAAWLAAAWQDLWRRLWAATAALAAFVALALTDVLPGLPGWLHILILIAVLGGIGGLAARAVQGFRWPTRDGARAWLESAAADLHRPLTTVEDRPALAASAFERALWQAHQDRARARLDQLRVNPPAPGVAARDRLALRAAAIVALAIAIVGAGPDAPGRLVRALMPAFDGGSADLTVKLWITPPVYTNRSPIYLEHPAAEGTVDAAATIDVPEGSKALVVVTGTARDTVLAADDAEFPLERLADSSLRLETPLPSARALTLTQRGRVIAAWSLNPLADLPPEIAWTREPAEAGRWRLRLDYRAVDDYGIARAVARISAGPELPAALAATAAEDAVEVELNTPPFNPKEAASASFHDLTAHPWAGFPVEIELAVTDQAEQTAVSEKLSAVLPERAFEHPVARELAAARKALFLDLAGAIRPVRGSLGRILQDPSAFGGDARVYLALSTARARLGLNGPEVAVRPLADLLWQAAIRIEDGNLVAAEQRLEAAEQALREAMERGATPAEISRLIDQLQRALAEYTRELAARMPEGEMSALTPPQDQQMFGPEDIAATMERLRQLAEMGAEDAARQMLSELQNMLQTLRSAAAAKNDNPTLRKAQDIMKDLRQLAEDQARLMEDSFQKAREQALDSIGGREPRPRREAGPRGR
ncbi:MAG: DUF4175 family protein, partial [Rhodospirillaceae bacterium]|nr:DUF4175 family protein [Rhodospirillaceae bacterium]